MSLNLIFEPELLVQKSRVSLVCSKDAKKKLESVKIRLFFKNSSFKEVELLNLVRWTSNCIELNSMSLHMNAVYKRSCYLRTKLYLRLCRYTWKIQFWTVFKSSGRWSDKRSFLNQINKMWLIWRVLTNLKS